MSHKWPWSSVRVIVGILPLSSLPSSPFSFFPPCLPFSLPSSLACHFLPSLPESLAESSHTCLQIPGVLFLGRVTMDTVIKLFQSYNTFHISKMRASDSSLTGLLWNLSKITCKVCTQWLSKWWFLLLHLFAIIPPHFSGFCFISRSLSSVPFLEWYQEPVLGSSDGTPSQYTAEPCCRESLIAK